MSDSFYITTPIYYVNDSPHIGHAYTSLACDVLARFYRLDGRHVRFLTGTDEHGQKVEKAAQAKGIDPQAFTDEVSQRFRDLAERMSFSHDDFIRTTEPRHKAGAAAIWKRMEEAGHIYLGSYAGWYAVRDEAYYAESELVDGKAPTGAPVEWVEEPSYFFNLSKWQDDLLKFYEENPRFIAPTSRRNEVISFVKGGLQDLSISRTSFAWGIDVPEGDGHVMYVWLDALTNYISALGYPDENGLYAEHWPASVHVVGKDILRFHAVYWPAFLMAAGLEPPKRVFAHGWWTNEGQKISKSLGNVIDPLSLIDEFGLDAVRYFLLREVPFGNDGDFSRRAMIGRMNADLANDIGNLNQRVLSMIFKNCDGALPEPALFQAEDIALLEQAYELRSRCRAACDDQLLHKMLEHIWHVIGEANRYVDAMAPWALRKTDKVRMNTVLYVLAEVNRHIAILTQPVMPGSMENILDQLGVQPDHRGFDHLGPEGAVLAPGTPINKPVGVFPRFVEENEAQG